MLVRADDEIYEVDSSYLGPPGHYLGRVRYKTLLLFPALYLPVLALMYSMGIPMTLLTIGGSFLICLKINQLLGKRFTRLTPFGSVLIQFFVELTAPRQQADKPEVSQLLTSRRVQKTVNGIDHEVLARPERRQKSTRRNYTTLPTWTVSNGGHDDDEQA